MFGRKNITLQQWHPKFLFDKNKISTLPVWIRLHGLPFLSWTNMVGKPLSCDEQTYNYTRLEYARVCVEIFAALPTVHKFEIVSPLSSEPIPAEIDYEWKPPRCDQCKIFCHCCPLTLDPTPKIKTKPEQNQTYTRTSLNRKTITRPPLL